MFLVTFVHVFPRSRVTWRRPSLVPAQICPFSRGDSAMANSVQAYSGLASSGVMPPVRCCFVLSFVLRSGLMISQLWPPFVVMCTNWLPT